VGVFQTDQQEPSLEKEAGDAKINNYLFNGLCGITDIFSSNGGRRGGTAHQQQLQRLLSQDSQQSGSVRRLRRQGR